MGPTVVIYHPHPRLHTKASWVTCCCSMMLRASTWVPCGCRRNAVAAQTTPLPSASCLAARGLGCSETRGLKQSKIILTSPESPRRLLETNRPYTTHLSDNIVPCVRERSSDKRDFRRPDYPSGMPLWRETGETSEGKSITLKLEITNSPSIGPRLPQQGCRQVVSCPRLLIFSENHLLTVVSTATTAVVSVPKHEKSTDGIGTDMKPFQSQARVT